MHFTNVHLLDLDLRKFTHLKTLQTQCFSYTKSTETYIPSHITEFGDYVFSYSNVEKVYIGMNDNNENDVNTENDQNAQRKTQSTEETLKEVKTTLFSNCELLKECYFGSTIESILTSSFENCTSLSTLTLSPHIKTVGPSSFRYCSSLTTVIIPNGSELSSIEGYAFSNTQLKTFITENTTEYTFEGGVLMNGEMTKIIYYISTSTTKSLIIPSTVVEICPNSFLGSTNLIEIIFSKGKLERIGYQSFMDCINLRRIVLPDSLKTIDVDAFKNCHKIVCGGLTLNASLIEQAKNAKIDEMPLSDGCLNNFDALLKKKTCKVNNMKKQVKAKYYTIFLLISAIN